MNGMQKHNFDKAHRHAFRATHPRSQGLVKGTFTVPTDLPPHLRQGRLVSPASSVFLQDNKEPGPRGMAVKISSVKGERLEDQGETNEGTQDYFFDNAPMIELTDVGTCLEIMQLREKHFDGATGLSLALKTKTDAMKQLRQECSQIPTSSRTVCSHSQPSALESTMVMALFPLLPTMSESAEKVSSNSPYTQLSDWLFDYFKGQSARYELKIQLGTSPEHHPTEDASIKWDEATSPYQTIGALDFPK
ncbi:hypothetical protein ACLMJK_000768 [Lecanora helva]